MDKVDKESRQTLLDEVPREYSIYCNQLKGVLVAAKLHEKLEQE